MLDSFCPIPKCLMTQAHARPPAGSRSLARWLVELGPRSPHYVAAGSRQVDVASERELLCCQGMDAGSRTVRINVGPICLRASPAAASRSQMPACSPFVADCSTGSAAGVVAGRAPLPRGGPYRPFRPSLCDQPPIRWSGMGLIYLTINFW